MDPGQAPPIVIDALLGLAVSLGLTLIIATADGGTRPPDAVAYLFALGFGALMLARRAAPRTVLALSVVGYYILDYPPSATAPVPAGPRHPSRRRSPGW